MVRSGGWRSRFLILSLLSGLSACAWNPSQPELETPALRSEMGRAALSAWTLKGRAQTTEQRASLRWRQQDQVFDLLLRGPFGFGSLRLVGTPEQVEISDGETTTISDDPVQEIWRRSGLYVPVAALPYWVRGLPAPQEPAVTQRNLAGHISVIEQAGWLVSLADYQPVGQVDFPHQVRMEHAPWVLTIEVSKWLLQ